MKSWKKRALGTLMTTATLSGLAISTMQAGVQIASADTPKIETFAGRGFDVLNGNQFRGNKYARPQVLDMSKVEAHDASDKYDLVRASNSKTDLTFAESATSYAHKISASMGGGMEGVFQADIDAAYDHDHAREQSNLDLFDWQQMETESLGLHLHAHDRDELRSVATDSFIRAIDNLDVSNTDEISKFFSENGTHVIRTANIGGSIDFKATTKHMTDNKIASFSGSVKATIATENGTANGSASAAASTAQQLSQSIKKSTTVTYGGAAQSWSDITAFNSGAYKAWADSLNKQESLTMIGADNGTLIPIWAFAKDSHTEAAMHNEYDKEVEAHKQTIDEYGKQLYVKDIVYGSDKNEGVALTELQNNLQQLGYAATGSKVVYVQDENSPEPNKVESLDGLYDLNDACSKPGNKSAYIFMAYTLTDNPKEALTGVRFYDSSKNPHVNNVNKNGNISVEANEAVVNQDLNEDAGGHYIYTIAEHGNKAGNLDSKELITALGIEDASASDKGDESKTSNQSYDSSLGGWGARLTDSKKTIFGANAVDLNHKAGGDFIYMHARYNHD
jgi:hypothetical protein